ncbi:MAG: ribonucleoside-diphosphate reductase subunit alpha, partial [Halothiobacillus sp.]|nr:ribonucleoside-diphosphate reductase subunit alpha [Halothiobacillus sp.]
MTASTATQTETQPTAARNMPSAVSSTIDTAATIPGQLRVIRRNGKVTAFDESKIKVAMTKAFLAVEGSGAAVSMRVHDLVNALSDQISSALKRRAPGGGTVHIEDIQDQVELALMREGHHKVARAYVLYREQQAQKRAAEAPAQAAPEIVLNVTHADGTRSPLDHVRLKALVNEACSNLIDVDPDAVLRETLRNLFDGVPEKEVNTALVMSARTLIEKDPNYSFVAARLLLDGIRTEALRFTKQPVTVCTQSELSGLFADYFQSYINAGIEHELLDPTLRQYDLKRLTAAIDTSRDLQFSYLGLQTLYDRYFLHQDGVRFELPQAFFMRVAMGLAINEIDREAHAIEFYKLLSSFDFMSSTPTLFNSGTLRPQLSSCYLTTVPDDLDG